MRQLSFLCGHPQQHWQCQKIVEEASERGLTASGLRADFKYLGDYLWLSLPTAQRREALAGHYQTLNALAGTVTPYLSSRTGTILWQGDIPDSDESSLVIFEPAKLAPMEGELQLRFSFRSRDLFTITFLLAPGHLFGSSAQTVLFIGGIQGGVDCRREIREASKINGEISPAKMLIIAIEAIAATFDIAEILAVSEDEQISHGYASDKMRLDYHAFWTEAGGSRCGIFYHLAPRKPDKPLAEIPISHRSRTKRKREKRAQIRESIEMRLRALAGGAAKQRGRDAEQLETVA
jgi:uncharacterized protein VirK/YbjX